MIHPSRVLLSILDVIKLKNCTINTDLYKDVTSVEDVQKNLDIHIKRSSNWLLYCLEFRE